MQSNPDPPKTPSSRMSNSASGSLRRGTEEGPVHTTSFQDAGPWKRWDSPPPTKPNPCGSMQRPLTRPLWGTLNPSGGPRQPTYRSWETLGATGHGPGFSFSPCWQSCTASGLGTWNPSVGRTFHPPNFSHFGTKNVTAGSPAFPCPRTWKPGENTSAPSACPTTTTSPQFSRGGGNPCDFTWVNSSRTDSAGLQWHCHKHMGAAAFMAQGGSTRGLQMWARWRSPQMARHYAAHPPTWRLPPTLHLPLPERPGPGRAYTRVRINTRDLWPKQAFKDNPRPYAPPPAHVEVTRPEPASGDHGDDSDTDTNEDPRTSEVPPPPWTPSHPSGQPHSHQGPRQPSPSPQTPNQLRPSDQHPPPLGPGLKTLRERRCGTN